MPLASSTLSQVAASPLRGVMLLAGAVGCGLLSVWIWMIGRVDGRFVLLDREHVAATLPNWLVLGAAAGAGLGAVGTLWALLRDHRLRATLSNGVALIRRRPKSSLFIGAIIAFGAVDLYELFVDAEARRYDRTAGIGLRKYMIREDAKSWLLFASTIMTALAISAFKPWSATCESRLARLSASLREPASMRRWLIAAFLLPVVLGGALNLFALDGVPHFSDSLTYQMQGRMLYAGQLTMEKPAHPELFIHSLFFVTDGQRLDAASNSMVYEGTRFFGKYPIGWPAVLGLFDTMGVGYLANATLAGLGALLTFGLARQVTSKQNAVLAALLFAVSPWAWFNGSHFASHVASMVAVNGFLFFFLKVLGAKSRAAYGAAAGAGLCLGAALLVRPFDAAMFALPAVLLSFALLLREPRKWITHGLVITLTTGVGIAIYLWSNAMTTGHPRISPYTLEGRWAADWDTTIGSIVHRFQFQWAEMNGRFPGYGVGGMTLAALGLLIAWHRGLLRRSAAFYVILASNLLFFAATTPFLFTNVWWGPRWLLPVTPLIALLMAQVVGWAMGEGEGTRDEGLGPRSSQLKSSDSTDMGVSPLGPRPSSLGPFLLQLLFAGAAVGLVFNYGGQWAMHRVAPPHNVSAAVHQRVSAMGLDNVVVGMPTSGDRAPFDARAGMVFMNAPLSANRVIYVRRIEQWADKARQTFPDRQLYELIADKEAENGFVIRKVGKE